MIKSLTGILVLTTALGMLTSCTRSHTVNDLRLTKPLVKMEFSGSVKTITYCVAELMDERMTLVGVKLSEGFLPARYAMTNHVRTGEDKASIISLSSGSNFIATVSPAPIFVVDIKASDGGSIATFHREPKSTFNESQLSKKIREIFGDCNSSQTSDK